MGDSMGFSVSNSVFREGCMTNKSEIISFNKSTSSKVPKNPLKDVIFDASFTDDLIQFSLNNQIEPERYYFHARHYDPVLGRFISHDPVSVINTLPFTHNRYQYAYNNPLKFIDPDGKLSQTNSGLFSNYMSSSFSGAKYGMTGLSTYIGAKASTLKTIDCSSSIGKSFWDLNLDVKGGFTSKLGAGWFDIINKGVPTPGFSAQGAVSRFYNTVKTDGAKYGVSEIGLKDIKAGDLILSGNLKHMEFIKSVKYENGATLLQTIGASSGAKKVITRGYVNPVNSWWSGKLFGNTSPKYIRVNE